MQGNEQLGELSAREIFNRILKGAVVRIPNDPVLAKQLQNHLNVIKSREKRIFSDLGLDFTSSVIKIIPQPEVPVNACGDPIFPIQYYEIKLVAPKKRRKYPAFVIQDHEPSPI